MRRTNFSEMTCPVARSLERVGEWWSMLILRDAFHGLTRFDQCDHLRPLFANLRHRTERLSRQ